MYRFLLLVKGDTSDGSPVRGNPDDAADFFPKTLPFKRYRVTGKLTVFSIEIGAGLFILLELLGKNLMDLLSVFVGDIRKSLDDGPFTGECQCGAGTPRVLSR